MLVYGDNLSVLKAFYDRGDVRPRLCYIDPPFATGRVLNGTHGSRAERNEEKAYEDTLRGKDFLEFLRKRLVFIREILTKDGSIYVHIDWKMSHYVRILMDEVFKPEHFVNEITRIKTNPKNFERPAYGNVKDTILFYSKGDSYIWNGSKETPTKEDIARLFPQVDKDGRRYTTNPLHAPSETKTGATGQEWKGMKPPKGRHWRYPPEKLSLLDQLGQIEWSNKGNPRKKIYADDALRRGRKRQDIWKFIDPAYPTYPTQKNLEMLKTIISASSNRGDLVLDCFSGSATTLVASSMLGRRWVGIDNSKKAIQVAQERLSEVKKPPHPFTLYDAV
ncbi:MAG: site-specific DNA-methyltransferase [Thaumarchaeota archaeon]|nr:site-specific DNA-methyltransferase [Nitrososphaerota archaeon]